MSNWEYDYSNLYNGQNGQNHQSGQSGQTGSTNPSGLSGQGLEQPGSYHGSFAQTDASAGSSAGAQIPGAQSYGAQSQSTAQGSQGADASGAASQAGQSTSSFGGYSGFTHGSYAYGGGQPPMPPKPPKKPSKWPKRVGAGLLALVVCVGAGFGGGYLGTLAASSNLSQAAGSDSSVSQTSTAVPTPAAETGAMTTSEIASKVGPSVVEVTTEIATTNPFFSQYVESGAGSGVIISSDGYIITNAHVVEGASQVTVTTQDRQSYTASIVGSDSQSDIAVLKIDATGLTAATIGDSDQLAVGEFVLAVGNPLGRLGGTVTDGIVSALDRTVEIDGKQMSLLQMDAAVSPGNSGGGLFNARGELIGIVNAKSNGENVEGIGFAIPINDAMNVANSLMTNGYVAGRPALGVSVIQINSLEQALQNGVSQLGVYIAKVNAGGAAEKAGLQVGDLLVSIDGTSVTSTSEVTELLQKYSAGDQVEVQVQRDRQLITVTVTLDDAGKTNQSAESTAADTTQSQAQNQSQQWNPLEGLW